METIQIQICTKCGKLLPLKDFIKDKKRKDGVRTRCKPCIKEYCRDNRERIYKQHSEWRKGNKEKIVECSKEYYQKNKEKVALYAKRWYQINKKKVCYQHHIYRENNREKVATSKNEWRNNNKSYFCVKEAKRRAAKFNKSLTIVESKAIEIYYDVCSEINELLDDICFHVDHIQPLSKGGAHHGNNLQILEASLNWQKNNNWPLTDDEELKYKGIFL